MKFYNVQNNIYLYPLQNKRGKIFCARTYNMYYKTTTDDLIMMATRACTTVQYIHTYTYIIRLTSPCPGESESPLLSARRRRCVSSSLSCRARDRYPTPPSLQCQTIALDDRTSGFIFSFAGAPQQPNNVSRLQQYIPLPQTRPTSSSVVR